MISKPINHSFFLLLLLFDLLLDDLSYLPEFLELINILVSHLSFIVNLLVVHQLIHIVRRDRSNDVLVLLVVPNLLLLVEGPLVQLVKFGKRPRLVIFLSLLLLLLLNFTSQDDLLLL